jgi:cytoskeleton protein RodZ
MSGFGERLRREREMRGVSLEEISDSTKIGTRSLKAIEDNEFDKLPGGIFNKGFVRAYSKFLGLDEDETVADFDAAWKEYQVARGQPIEPVIELEPAPEPPKTPWFAIASVIVLLAAIFGLGWLFMLRSQRTRTGPASQLPAIAPAESSELQPVKTQSPAAPAETGTADPSASTPSPSAMKTSSQSSVALEESKGGADTKPATALPNSDSSVGNAVAVEASPIQLKVVAHEDSWYSLSADGKDLGQGILGAQKSRNIRAQKEVHLKLGNAGGVEISFNGKPVNLDGEPKQVRELTFTPDGLHQ